MLAGGSFPFPPSPQPLLWGQLGGLPWCLSFLPSYLATWRCYHVPGPRPASGTGGSSVSTTWFSSHSRPGRWASLPPVQRRNGAQRGQGTVPCSPSNTWQSQESNPALLTMFYPKPHTGRPRPPGLVTSSPRSSPAVVWQMNTEVFIFSFKFPSAHTAPKFMHVQAPSVTTAPFPNPKAFSLFVLYMHAGAVVLPERLILQTTLQGPPREFFLEEGDVLLNWNFVFLTWAISLG